MSHFDSPSAFLYPPLTEDTRQKTEDSRQQTENNVCQHWCHICDSVGAAASPRMALDDGATGAGNSETGLHVSQRLCFFSCLPRRHEHSGEENHGQDINFGRQCLGQNLDSQKKVSEELSIPIEHQLLCFTGPPLINAHILQDLGVKENSVLCLLDRRKYYIVVSIDGCNNILLFVEASDIAEDLKKRIERKVGIPEPQQLLVFDRICLDETQPLSQLGLRPGSILHVFTVCPALEWTPAFPA